MTIGKIIFWENKMFYAKWIEFELAILNYILMDINTGSFLSHCSGLL